jgi:hypothetical protein
MRFDGRRQVLRKNRHVGSPSWQGMRIMREISDDDPPFFAIIRGSRDSDLPIANENDELGLHLYCLFERLLLLPPITFLCATLTS